MKRALMLAALTLASCEQNYGVRFSDTSVPPLAISLTPEQATLFAGAVVRTTMSLTAGGSVSDEPAELDLELRSDNPFVVETYRGIDPFTFVIVGASAGQTQLGAYYRDKRIATIATSVAAQPAP